MRVAACMIFTKSHLAYARVLCESFLAQHPDIPVFGLLVDKRDGFDASKEKFTVIDADAINAPQFQKMVNRYSPLELCCAVKPSLALHLFKQGYDKVLYFDTDILVTGSCTEIIDALDTDSLVLTPHLLDASAGPKFLKEHDLLSLGAYNLGFFAIRKEPVTEKFLTWWAEQLVSLCLVRPHQGLFLDQRWMDLAPAFLEKIKILRSYGCNVSYWNLHERTITNEHGKFFVNSKPMTFYHFSGYKPSRPDLLSTKHSLRTADQIKSVQALYETYRKKLMDAGHENMRSLSYSLRPRGEPIPWTNPLGSIKRALRLGGMSAIFKGLKKLWVAVGSPFPGFVRGVRHNFFGRWWPVDTILELTPPRFSSFSRLPAQYDVAVIITSHNYGHYLEETIQSVLTQTHRPKEIVVVDDASSDNTPAVAQQFASRNVRYVRGEWRNVSEARNRGAMETSAPFLMFLDADDILPPSYLSACLKTLRDPSVAIAYGDMKMFQEKNQYWHTGPFTRSRLMRHNFISSHAVIRRDVFCLAGGQRDPLKRAHEDWDTWKRMTIAPWKAEHAPTHVKYRVHSQSALQKRFRDPKRLYRDDADVLRSPITIFSAFHDDTHLAQYLENLRSLDVDTQQIRLHWLYDGTDPAIAETLRAAAASMNVRDVLFEHRPSPPLLIAKGDAHERFANDIREAAILQSAMNCTTDYVFFWKPGVRVPADILDTLSLPLDHHIIGIFGLGEKKKGLWNVWKRNNDMQSYCETKDGIPEIVQGGDLDAALLRADLLRTYCARTEYTRADHLTPTEILCLTIGRDRTFLATKTPVVSFPQE